MPKVLPLSSIYRAARTRIKYILYLKQAYPALTSSVSRICKYIPNTSTRKRSMHVRLDLMREQGSITLCAFFQPNSGNLFRFSTIRSRGRRTSTHANGRAAREAVNYKAKKRPPGLPDGLKFSWCRQQESNPQPTDYKSVALPLRHAGKTVHHYAISSHNANPFF